MTNNNLIGTEIINLLQKHNQQDQLPQIISDLQKELDRSSTVSIISATTLDQNERENIEKIIFQKWGDHKIIITTDPALLSGIIIRFKDSVYNFSGKNALSQLRTQLQEV